MGSRSKNTATRALEAVSKEQRAWSEDEVAGAGNYIHVAFVVAPSTSSSTSSGRFRKPHQVFVKYTHKETGISSYFVAQSDTDGDEGGVGGANGHKYRSSVSVAQEAPTFYHANGKYDLSVIVGDSALEGGVDFKLGAIEIKFPEDPNKGKIAPLYVKSLMDASGKTLEPLPEIAHQMRPPPKNAPKILSILFTALSLAPLFCFVGFVVFIEKPDVAYISSSPFAGLYAAGVAGILILYTAYWFRMPGADFYQTIYYLCAIVPIFWFIARRGISNVIAMRVEQEAKAGKSD